MKYLVLGAEGFVGKPLCEYLRSQGAEVVPFDLKRGAQEDARVVRLPLEGVAGVFFLAWDVGGAKYLYRHEIQFRQLDWNLKLLLNVMPQLQTAGVPFLFVSSQLAEEYDTVYGVTKRLGEVWTHLMAGVRVRLWNVYGPLEPVTERSHVIADFVWQAVTKGEIRMLTTGAERRQFIHVDDVCRGFHAALEGRLTGVYDISSFEWVSVLEVAQVVARLAGARVVPGEQVGSTPITPMQGRVPGWLPHVSLETGLGRMVEAARSQLLNSERCSALAAASAIKGSADLQSNAARI
ncbi:MAG: NAD(P)-dependent oxidoreductase [Verrucomicrobia bacterium]|nr:NAD(P)-dependent oxidoreductase [Verrucomicrobiota bacterium]